MKSRRTIEIVAVMIMALCATQLKAADENRPAELKVLDRWVGEWDSEITIKPNRDMPQGLKSNFKTVIRWAVNERFIRCDADGEGSAGERKFKDAFMWVSTFDPREKAYTSTVFWGNVGADGTSDWGGGLRGLGAWDEKEQTMTTRTAHPDGAGVDIGVTQWLDKDTHKFAQSSMDKNGKVMMEMEGVARRRK